eukprot:CAMPEP_0114992296 /NCGR_PEP_ID=MMETSP0216-20121206/11859_1 /TAXON_ID=223996 /ORGANISM="Protocruzia adherens, Strain Boccale" /LENGTH=445 /DNA_ID=CAMNT_0002355739 /DNA_START=31 /DNA_END=1368 /DNA_ORIENTATION=-
MVEPKGKHTFDVLIIGGGVAGLSAGQALAKKGINHCVLEGSSRLGGRVHSINFAGFTADLGAGWIHGSQKNPIYELAKREKLSTYKEIDDDDIEDNEITIWHASDLPDEPSVKDLGKCWSLLEKFVDAVEEYSKEEEEDVDGKVGQYLDTFLKKKHLETNLQKAYFKYALFTELEGDYGTSSMNLSSWWFDDDDELRGGHHVFRDGYASILPSLQEGVNSLTNQIVSDIDWSENDSITVTTKEGISYSTKRLIVTVSIGVLQQEKIKFTPPLPKSKLDNIKMFGIGTFTKIYIEFEDSFWGANQRYLLFVSANPQESILFQPLTPERGKNVLLVFLHPNKEEEFKEKPEEEIIDFILRALKMKFPSCPSPKSSLISRWATNQFTCGSYSHISEGNTDTNPAKLLQEPVENRLFFAGEATSPEFIATVHGAHLSGIREAKKVSKTF